MRTVIVALLLGLGACSSGPRRDIVQNKGSDTMVNLAQAWAEAFEQTQATYSLAVSGGGSGTGIAALIEGTTDIANTSRPLTDAEIEQATRTHGVAPDARVVALDALTVFVHPDNPLRGLDFDELACIYGEGGDCESWSDVRGTVVPGCAGNRIVRVGRQSNSGTAQYFRESVLGKGRDLRLGSLDLNGSSEVVRLVRHTPCAIAYVGLGYLDDGVKPLCIARQPGDECIAPSTRNAATHRYPITRALFMVTAGTPTPGAATFLAWVQGDEARTVLAHTGYVAPPPGAQP